MAHRTVLASLVILGLLLMAPLGAGAGITPGTPTTTEPSYLSDGAYWFGITVPDPLPAVEFLLPIEMSGAINLQRTG